MHTYIHTKTFRAMLKKECIGREADIAALQAEIDDLKHKIKADEVKVRWPSIYVFENLVADISCLKFVRLNFVV